MKIYILEKQLIDRSEIMFVDSAYDPCLEYYNKHRSEDKNEMYVSYTIWEFINGTNQKTKVWED